MPLPRAAELAAGKIAKSSSVLVNDNFLLDLIDTGIDETRVQGCYVANLVGNGAVISPTLLPAFGTADGIPITNGASSHALHTQSLGLPYISRIPTAIVTVDNPGRPHGAYGGFFLCDQDNDEVHFYTHAQPLSGLFLKTVYTLDSGDQPTGVAASKSGIVYVACEGTQKIRKIDTRRPGQAEDFVDLGGSDADWTDASSELGPIVINRLNTQLYVAGRKAGSSVDTAKRRVVQISIPTGAVDERALATQFEIVDLAFMYGGTAERTDPQVLVARRTNASNTGEVLRVLESTWAAAATITDVWLALLANDQIACMVEHANGIALIGQDNGATLCWMIIAVRDEGVNPALGMHGRIISTTQSGGAVRLPMPGTMCSDGRTIYFLTSGGVVNSFARFYRPGMSDIDYYIPRAYASGTQVQGGGTCFTGRAIVHCNNIGAATAAQIAMHAPF